MSSSFFLPFVKKERIAKDTWTFYFDKTKNPKYNFLPGQYTKITLPIKTKDGKGSYRFFTTASSPLDKNFLKITTTIHSNASQRSDFKKALFLLNPKEEISFYGPMGGFFLDEYDTSARVFLAGGIGITPFYSMILYAAEKNLSIPLTLIVSFTSKDNVIFKEELEKAAEKNKNIKVFYILERLNVKSLYSVQTDRSIYMVSGKPEMIDTAVGILVNMGIEESKIKTDIFTGY